MKKEPIKFVRFGGLSPLKQDHYESGEDKTYHNPPRRKGFYAFPWPYMSFFLLGATYTPGHVSNKSSWILDKDGNKMDSEEFLLEYDADSNPVWKPEVYAALKRRGLNHTLIWTQAEKEYDENDPNPRKFYLVAIKRPKTFSYEKEIWHHLGEYMQAKDIIETSGSWTLSTISDYRDAFATMKHKLLQDSHKDRSAWKKEGDSVTAGVPNPFKRSNGWFTYCRDHLEVFIERL